MRYHRTTQRLRCHYIGRLIEVNSASDHQIIRCAPSSFPLSLPTPHAPFSQAGLEPQDPEPATAASDIMTVDNSTEQDGSSSNGEEEVAEVICHFGKGSRLRYRVLWARGDETIEPPENLIDIIDGEQIINEALQIYLQENRDKCN